MLDIHESSSKCINHCKYALSGMPGPAESDSKKWVSNISGMTWGMKLIFCTWLDSHRYILIQVVVRYTWHVKSNSKYLFNSISKRNWAMVIEPLYQQIISAILSDLTVIPNCTFTNSVSTIWRTIWGIQSILLYEGLFEVYNQFFLSLKILYEKRKLIKSFWKKKEETDLRILSYYGWACSVMSIITRQASVLLSSFS